MKTPTNSRLQSRNTATEGDSWNGTSWSLYGDSFSLTYSMPYTGLHFLPWEVISHKPKMFSFNQNVFSISWKEYAWFDSVENFFITRLNHLFPLRGSFRLWFRLNKSIVDGSDENFVEKVKFPALGNINLRTNIKVKEFPDLMQLRHRHAVWHAFSILVVFVYDSHMQVSIPQSVPSSKWFT